MWLVAGWHGCRLRAPLLAPRLALRLARRLARLLAGLLAVLWLGCWPRILEPSRLEGNFMGLGPYQ